MTVGSGASVEPADVAGSAVFLVPVEGGQSASRLSWPAMAVLQAADAVLFDADLDPGILAFLPPGSSREAMPSPDLDGDVEIARIRKLAADGWHVVRLIRDNADDTAMQIAAARLGRAGITVRAFSGPRGGAEMFSPMAFGTSLNGLAG